MSLTSASFFVFLAVTITAFRISTSVLYRLAERIGPFAPALTAYLGVVAFFVTFLVMGIWHGTTAVFVIYGLLMGAGASINKILSPISSSSSTSRNTVVSLE